jgi:nitrile hydratase
VNGIHDMGGMDGFGRVVVERDEPVFHARWEARVFGMSLLVRPPNAPNIDARRHALERLDPARYLTLGYYGRWLERLERGLVESGLLGEGEIEAQITGRPLAATRPAALPPRPPAPPHPFVRAVERAPAFRAGDGVRTRNHQPPGHTRLPGYARARRGTIVRVYPACVLPDTNAHGRGECPEYVYAVRFEGRELWGDAAEPGTCVHVDLFESYLEPGRAA